MRSVTNPIGFHAFAYVNGNPVRLVDPFGQFAFSSKPPSIKKIVIGAVAVGAGVAVGVGNYIYDSLTGSSDSSSEKNTQIQIQACEKPNDDDRDELYLYRYGDWAPESREKLQNEANFAYQKKWVAWCFDESSIQVS